MKPRFLSGATRPLAINLAAGRASRLILLGVRCWAAAVVTALSLAAEPDWGDPATIDRQQVIERTMLPFTSTNNPGVDTRTLTGKVMCGYQGWFGADGDGVGRGWYHWAGRNGFKSGSCKIDLWPDVSELAPEERYATAFRHIDGRVAEVFSAFNTKTVSRHFQWMPDYELDGVFVQRFAEEVRSPKGLRQFNVVLDHCRKGANRYGRMFDEVDEGTAIFKVTNDPPVGDSQFVAEEGLPSDHYLRLVGQAGRMIRGEIGATESLPKLR